MTSQILAEKPEEQHDEEETVMTMKCRKVLTKQEKHVIKQAIEVKMGLTFGVWNVIIQFHEEKI